MSTPKSDYMLLFRGPDWDTNLTPEETERVMGQVMAWFESLQQQGKVKAGQPLGREGKLVSGKKRVVADGPFAESKEAVGGYLVLQVDDQAEAVAIAKSCPTLDHGISIEVRPVAEECPIFQRMKKRQSLAMA